MKKRKNKKGFLIGGIAAGAVVILAGGGILAWKLLINTATPQETVKNYFALVEKGQYDKMYAMLSERTRETVSEKEFTERNQNIYEGIEAKDIKISLSEREKLKGSPVTVKYSETMQTSAEEISFDNEMTLQKEDGEYKIDWDSTIIFPNLQDSYKVQIQTESADRGTIYDRNGVVLAGNGTVLEVGLVPGKWEMMQQKRKQSRSWHRCWKFQKRRFRTHWGHPMYRMILLCRSRRLQREMKRKKHSF